MIFYQQITLMIIFLIFVIRRDVSSDFFVVQMHERFIYEMF